MLSTKVDCVAGKSACVNEKDTKMAFLGGPFPDVWMGLQKPSFETVLRFADLLIDFRGSSSFYSYFYCSHPGNSHYKLIKKTAVNATNYNLRSLLLADELN